MICTYISLTNTHTDARMFYVLILNSFQLMYWTVMKNIFSCSFTSFMQLSLRIMFADGGGGHISIFAYTCQKMIHTIDIRSHIMITS